MCRREQKRQLEREPSNSKALDGQLSQELVASRVLQEATSRRLSLVEGERDRVQKTLQETQVCGGHQRGVGGSGKKRKREGRTENVDGPALKLKLGPGKGSRSQVYYEKRFSGPHLSSRHFLDRHT